MSLSRAVSFAKGRVQGTDGAHINIVGLVNSGSYPPGANGRVKTSHGRFNASVLACESRTDLVVRIFEGYGTLPGRGARPMNIGALPRRCRPFGRTQSCGSENKKDLGEDTSLGEITKGGRSGGIVVGG